MLARTIRGSYSQLWCTHVGQEAPKLVYTLFCCKLVDLVLPVLPSIFPSISQWAQVHLCNVYLHELPRLPILILAV